MKVVIGPAQDGIGLYVGRLAAEIPHLAARVAFANEAAAAAHRVGVRRPGEPGATKEDEHNRRTHDDHYAAAPMNCQ